MFKLFKSYWNGLLFGMIALGTSVILIVTATIFTPPILAIEPDTSLFTTEQRFFSGFADVSPSDWAFQAIDSLSNRYGMAMGYPDGTFRGNRAVRRGELAQWFSSALDQLGQLIAINSGEIHSELATPEDWSELQQSLQTLQNSIRELRESPSPNNESI